MLVEVITTLLAATCADCHPTEAQRFATSRHARAFEVPVFAVAYPQARTTWCLRCHLPEGRPHAGLSCASCHRGEHGQSAPVGCNSCHEFNTPLPPRLEPVVYSDQPLQTTVSEAEGRACSECHDAHAALGSHDLPTLQRAVTFTSNGRELTVRANTAHDFPTGDPFHRLELIACDDPGCTGVVERHMLSKNFAWRDGKWTKVRDSSIVGGASRTLRFEAGRYWRATYFYGDPQLASGQPSEEVSVELARGAF